MKTKMLLKKGTFTALCILLHIAMYGQDSLSVQQPDTLMLDLEQSIVIALDQNPTIKVAEMEITKADYAKKETIGGLFPDISASASYTRNLEKQTMNLMGQSMKIGTDNSWAAGFSAGLPLINVPLWQSIKLTSEVINQKLETARSSKINMVSSVINAYYAVLNAKDSYDVLLESFNTANENLRISQKRFEQGMASEYDVIQAEVQVQNIQPNLIAAKNRIDLTTLQLKVLMGLPSDYPVNVAGSLSDYAENMFDAVEIANVDTSLADNPTIRSLEISTNLLERQLKLQKAQWYPTLSLAFVYQWTSLNDDFDFAQYQVYPYSTLGVTLSFPIFQGGARYYKQKQAQIAYDEMQYTMEDTRRQLGMQLQSSVDQIRVSVEQIDASKKAMASAEKGLKIAQKRYEVGAGTSLELISSENSLTQAKLNYYQSIYNYIVAKNSLDQVLGNAYNTYVK